MNNNYLYLRYPSIVTLGGQVGAPSNCELVVTQNEISEVCITRRTFEDAVRFVKDSPDIHHLLVPAAYTNFPSISYDQELEIVDVFLAEIQPSILVGKTSTPPEYLEGIYAFGPTRDLINELSIAVLNTAYTCDSTADALVRLVQDQSENSYSQAAITTQYAFTSLSKRSQAKLYIWKVLRESMPQGFFILKRK